MPNGDDLPTVKPGSAVRVREDGGLERIVRIRSDAREAWAADSISANTPLARALMGHKPGDVVEVQPHPVLSVSSIVIVAIE